MRLMRVVKRLVLVLTIISSLLLAAERANAQHNSIKMLTGTWKGTITTSFEGQNYKPAPVWIKFEGSGKVLFAMSEVEEGTYVRGASLIRISLRGNVDETIVLEKIRVGERSLKAEIKLPDDLPRIISRMYLKKLIKNYDRDIVRPSDKCSTLAVPDDAKSVLKKYLIECPVAVPPTWQGKSIVAKAINEILDNHKLLEPDNYESPFGVSYNERIGAFWIKVSSYKSLTEVERLIKPLFQDPNRFVVLPPCLTCLVITTAYVGKLKSTFIANEQINYDLLWPAILMAAETVQDVRVNLATQKQQMDGKSIETKFKRLDLQDGFIVGEKTKIQMTDPSDKLSLRSSIAVRIVVESQLLMRRVSDRNWIKIDLVNIVQGDTRRLTKSSEIENPYMEAILSSILKRD